MLIRVETEVYMRRISVVAVLVTLVALAALAAVPAGLAGNGGNSANAKLCQKGGWTSLHREDGSGFASAGDCVSYAAHGGSLAAVQITASTFYYSSSFGGWYAVHVTGTGFTPNALITFTVDAVDGALGNNTLNDGVYADGGGSFDSGSDPATVVTWLGVYCSKAGTTLHVTATDGTHVGSTDFVIPSCA